MFPFISIYHHTYSTFFFMIAVAIALAAVYSLFQAWRHGLSVGHTLALSCIAAIFGLVGMRIFHVLVEAPLYYWQHPESIFHIYSGGFVSWGAMIGVVLAAAGYFKVMKLSAWRYLDVFALGFPIIHFFVRLGCLGAGCCFGKATTFPIYLVFADPASVAAKYYPGMPLHAVQIYSMLNAVLLFIIVHWIDKKARFDGQVFLSFAILYSLARIAEEFLRGDVDRGVYLQGILSTGQVMSALLMIAAALLYRYRRLEAQAAVSVNQTSVPL